MGLVTAAALVGVGLAVAPVAPAPASAERGDITTFTDVDGQVDQPTDIAVAPDGIVWFTSQANDLIGRLDPTTEDIAVFGADAPAGNIDQPNSIAVGASGPVWFTNGTGDQIGRLNRSTGAINVFGSPDVVAPRSIVSDGADGAWFTSTSTDRIGHIDPDGSIDTYPTGGLSRPGRITRGFDGRLWFSGIYLWPQFTRYAIGQMNPISHAVTLHIREDHYNVISDLAAWPDGSVEVLRGTTFTSVERFNPATGGWRTDQSSIPSSARLTSGPGHSVWATVSSQNQVRRIGLRGTTQVFTDLGGGIVGPEGIATAPDGTVWFASAGNDRIARIDATTPEVMVALTGQPSSVVAGGDINYELTVTNTGTTPLTSVVVTDPQVPDCAGPLADLASRASVTIECTVTTPTSLRAPFVNQVTVTTGQTAPVSASATTTVTAHPSLAVAVDAAHDWVVVGEPVEMTVTVTNTGDVPLTGVEVTDPDAPQCAGTLDTIPVDEVATIECDHLTSPSDVGTYLNQATAVSDETASVNSNTLVVQVGAQRSLSVQSTAEEASVTAGDPIHLHITLDNDGDVPVDDVVVTVPVADECAREIESLAADSRVTIDCVHTSLAQDTPVIDVVVVVHGDRLPPVSSDPSPVEVTIPPAGFTDVAPSAFYADAVDWAVLFGVVPGVSDTTFRPSKPVARARLVDALFRMMDHPAGSPRHPFADVPRDAWFRRAVDWAVAHGLVSGARPSFRPDDAVSRADVVKLAWLMVGAPTGNPAHGYTDVPVGARYNAALKWAEANGLLDGFVAGSRFKPDRAVTRGQLADVLFRLAGTEAAWPQGPGDPPPPSTVLF